MAGKYIVIPGLGNTIGSMTMPVLGTYMVYGPHPENFLHSQVALAVVNIGNENHSLLLESYFLSYQSYMNYII